ncbi:MAG TPA: ATP-binding protein [Methanomicrobiales archaeon]|jgi:anti-sigma regulatory factor (Ser/Thr protein kinase)|nr:ATP-binding protein [Methanomicrobiales archaeon]
MAADLTLTVRAEIRELPGLLDAIAGFLQEEGLRREDITGIQIAVDEAFSNIVTHGYRGGAGAITLRCRVYQGEAEVVMEDRAPPSDPTALPPPDRSSDLARRPGGGLGVHLMKNFMDRISYEYRDGMNILTMGKRLEGRG